ncbi:MAG: NAD-dependent epimerase/dehydratase family protein, partial [Leifsonia sp.]
MAATRTLFIGGTGVISSACVAEALEQGHEVTVVNRGSSSTRPLPDGVEVLHADIRDPESVHRVLGERSFDVAAEFLAFTPEHVRTDFELFEGRVGQY